MFDSREMSGDHRAARLLGYARTAPGCWSAVDEPPVSTLAACPPGARSAGLAASVVRRLTPPLAETSAADTAEPTTAGPSPTDGDVPDTPGTSTTGTSTTGTSTTGTSTTASASADAGAAESNATDGDTARSDTTRSDTTGLDATGSGTARSDSTGGPASERLALLLAARRFADLPTDGEVLDAAVAMDKLVCWAQAKRATLLSEFATRRPGDDPILGTGDTPTTGSRWAPDEVGTALGRSRHTARTMLVHATTLTEVLPDVLAAMEAGHLDEAKARVLCDLVPLLGADAAAKVAARVLPRAAGQAWTPFRAAVRRAILRVDPDGEQDRHRKARGERRVSVRQVEDGMATLWALLPAAEAAEAWEMLTRLAKGLDFPGDPDPRTLDARRADLLVDLLTGKLSLHRDFPAPTADPADAAEHSGDQATTRVGATDVADTDIADTDIADTDIADTDDDAAQTGQSENGKPASMRSDRDEADRDEADGDEADGDEADGDEADGDEADGDEAADADTTAEPGTDGADTAEKGDQAATADTGHDADLDGEPGLGGASARPGSEDRRSRRRDRSPSGTPVRDRVPVVHLGTAKPLVQIVIGLDTLLGVRDDPVELIGHGPVLAAAARAIAADGVWKRLATDPISGALLDYGRSTYQPPAALRDFVTARDQTCRFPGCGRRARDGEIDHLQARADDGDTDRINLYGLCVHHHKLKHRPGWQVQVLHDGRLLWTAPTKHRYLSESYDYRNHLPEPDDLAA